MLVIAIAGGSGSGKSTVSYRLVDTYPDIFEVVNLDDYQKLKDDPDLPKIDGMINWDHPDVIRWSDLLTDIKILERDSHVTIQTWSHCSNPDYFQHGNMIPRAIHPQKVLIIEGYLALWNKDLRRLYKRSYYLDSDEPTMLRRRKKFKNSDYEAKVLIPMHKKYVEPTKNSLIWFWMFLI